MRLEFEPRTSALPLVENEIHLDSSAIPSWDFDSLLKRGVAAAQSGDRDHARKLLSQATALNPVSEDAWMWLASISEYPEELLAFLNRVLEINPGNTKASEWRTATQALLAKTFVQRALAARNEGSFELANQCLEQAVAHDSECESAWYWKGYLAESADQKLKHFARVLEINPGNKEASEAVSEIKNAQVLALLQDARVAANDGDHETAVSLLNELTRHESAEIREAAWTIMCDVAETEDQKVEFLNEVLEANPDNAYASAEIEAINRSRSMAEFDEARSAAAAGDRVKAVEILDGFVKRVPDSVDAWLLKSHLSEGLDQKVEALEKALEIDPENAAARSGLAFLALTFGSNTEPKTSQTMVAEPVEEELFVPEAIETAPLESVMEDRTYTEVASEGQIDDDQVEEFQPVQQMDAEVEFAYRTTEEAVDVAETEAVSEAPQFDQHMPFEAEAVQEVPQPFEEFTMPEPAPEVEMEHSDSGRSVEEIFGSFAEADPASETMDSLSPFVQEAMNQDPFAAEPNVSPSDEAFEEHLSSCPFCASPNDPQCQECGSCNATLTLSDIEKLLSGTSADKEIVQRAVTSMEADWNTRDFSEAEFTALGVGHFNLGNADAGHRYLQEAARVNPNNVILGAQVNTIAIRLAEIRRQHETYDSMPKGKTILVVDDSPTVRKLISGKLEKSGHNVVCAVDGIDALARLEEGMPDLVLLDITMPRMDGYEVCKQIRSNPAGKDLPVVMISGKDGFFDKVRGRMAGTSGYVTKPFGPETLMKALETYLLPDDVEAN